MKADRCFSKGRLRDEFRMKPKPGVEPVSFYKNGYGGQFGVYRIADCQPMRRRGCSPASQKQIRAQSILSVKARMRSNLAKASVMAQRWVALEPLVLDTETTGLGERDQVIELAVTDIRGAVLLCTRLRPTVEIDPQAMGVHGITETELSNEPTWTQVAPALARLLSGRHLVIFNSSFDSRMLRQTASAFGDQLSWWQEQNCLCAMKLAADAFGSTNRHGTISLADATCEETSSRISSMMTTEWSSQSSQFASFPTHGKLPLLMPSRCYANQRGWTEICPNRANLGTLKVVL